MRLKLISCEIFYREMCAAIAHSPNTIDVTFLPKGLHDIGREPMLTCVQQAIDEVTDPRFEAILLGYGLCNKGIEGLEARTCPVVIPRAHDCITLFLGSRQRYASYFESHPGTYFLTAGWLERNEIAPDLKDASIPHQVGMDVSYEELVARYGVDNAKYLYAMLGDTLRNYTRFTFVRTGSSLDEMFEEQARAKAQTHHLPLETVDGDLTLVERLVNGPWDSESFLVLPPGHRVRAQLDNGIIEAEKIS